jgi:branched-chain amino acid transport system permease protein
VGEARDAWSATLIQLANGLVYGGLLFILSVGLVLIFGLRGVVNFAHGTMFALGAYISYSVALHLGYWLGLAVAVAVLFLIGALLDAFVFRPLQDQQPVTTMLVTFGLFLLLTDLISSIWGKEYYSGREPESLGGTIAIGSTPFPLFRLAIIALAVLLLGALLYWLGYTRTGLYIRACSIDRVTTAMQGVNTDRLSLLVIAIGSALTGLAGAVSAPLVAISPTMGNSILIDCFIVIVTGGTRSPLGTFVSALLIGQVRTLGAVYLPSLASTLPLILMGAVLAIRPHGLSETAR